MGTEPGKPVPDSQAQDGLSARPWAAYSTGFQPAYGPPDRLAYRSTKAAGLWTIG